MITYLKTISVLSHLKVFTKFVIFKWLYVYKLFTHRRNLNMPINLSNMTADCLVSIVLSFDLDHYRNQMSCLNVSQIYLKGVKYSLYLLTLQMRLHNKIINSQECSQLYSTYVVIKGVLSDTICPVLELWIVVHYRDFLLFAWTLLTS